MNHPTKWHKFVRLGGLTMAAALVLSLLTPLRASALEPVDLDQRASLTVIDQAEGAPISGADFHLYQVAAVSQDVIFTATEDFAQSGVSLDTSEDKESWADRAVTLEAYVVERSAEGDAIPEIAAGTTDGEGAVQFSDLKPGLYLLVGDQKRVGNTLHKPLATLISLPNLDTAGGWDYHPTIYAKNASRTRRDETVDLSVVKIWKDEGKEDLRPQRVTVTLYEDDQEYDTVTLSAENSWRYTWENLDAMSDWFLMERDVPAEYTVTSVAENAVFVVTNTYREETPEEPTPTSPAPSAPVSPVPSTPVSPAPSTPTTPTTPTQSRLPQTGQLWWPVSLLSVAGLTLILTGLSLRKKENEP
jgi:hypothetical protein